MARKPSKPKPRSGVAVAALRRHGGPMKDSQKRQEENKNPDYQEEEFCSVCIKPFLECLCEESS